MKYRLETRSLRKGNGLVKAKATRKAGWKGRLVDAATGQVKAERRRSN